MYYDEENDRTEKLTKENIQKDLRRAVLRSIFATFLVVASLIFLLWAVMAVFETTIIRIPRLVFSILAGLTFLYGIVMLVMSFIRLYRIKCMQFYITTDILTDKIEEERRSYGGKYKTYYTQRWLRFNYHTYRITARYYYRWSRYYFIDAPKLYTSSKLEDKFVLVSFRPRQNPLMVYNTRFFEWTEE